MELLHKSVCRCRRGYSGSVCNARLTSASVEVWLDDPQRPTICLLTDIF